MKILLNSKAKVTFKPSTKLAKKLQATFIFPNGDIRVIHFGARGYSDYTIHKDPQRRWRYIQRHAKMENHSNPYTAGSLSRYILWELPTRREAIKNYKKIFGLE